MEPYDISLNKPRPTSHVPQPFTPNQQVIRQRARTRQTTIAPHSHGFRDPVVSTPNLSPHHTR